MTLPRELIRDVFSSEHPDQLLHLLSEQHEPLLVTHARDLLGLQPEEFQRARRKLEKWALVQFRVVPLREQDDRRRRVQIQITKLGRAIVRLNAELDNSWQHIVESEGLPQTVLMA